MNKAAQEIGRLGGRAGRGKSKARTTEQARAAANVRWRKIYGNALWRKIVAAIFERCLDAFAALFYRNVGKSNDVKITHFAGPNVHFNFHQISIDAEDRGAEGFEVHRVADTNGVSVCQSNANDTFDATLIITSWRWALDGNSSAA